MLRRLFIALGCALLAGEAAAKPPQIVYAHAGQTLEVFSTKKLAITCMSGPAADPPGGKDKFHLFSGEIVATMIADGVRKEPKSLQAAIEAQQLRIVGSGSPDALVVQVVKPALNVRWELSVVRPTLAVPDKHGLKKDELDHRIARFAKFQPELAEIDGTRALLRKQFQHSAMPSAAFGLALRPHFWSGHKGEFPWESTPESLKSWTSQAVRKVFLVSGDPELTYLQCSLLAGEPLQQEQRALLANHLGEHQISTPNQMSKAEQQVRALTQLPQTRTLPGIFRLTQAAAGKDHLTESSTLRELYEEMAEEYHRSELQTAKRNRDLKAGDLVLHIFDGIAFLSASDAAPTRIRIPATVADAMRVFERDFKQGGFGILKKDREWLKAATQGKRPNGEVLRQDDAGAGYFQILGAILQHLPPPVKDKKLNLLVWATPQLHQFDMAKFYALLRAADVEGFDRSDIRWFEVADGPTRASPLASAARHLRHLERFPDNSAELLALTAPATAGEAGAEEWAGNLFGRYLQGKGKTWQQYQKRSLPGVLKVKQVVKEAQGTVIQPPTLQSFIDALKRHIQDRPGVAISVTIVTHRQGGEQGGEELVFFGREEARLETVLHHVVAANLHHHYVIFNVLCCGLASSKYATLLQDQGDIKLLMAPFQDIEVGDACRFQAKVNSYRRGRGGLMILDAIEAARFETMKDVRKRLQDGSPPKLPFPSELSRTRVVRPLQRATLGA